MARQTLDHKPELNLKILKIFLDSYRYGDFPVLEGKWCRNPSL